MDDGNRTDELSTADVTQSGGGYRAISTHAGAVDWACKHVHFTDRSARNCAEQHVQRASADATAAG